MKMDATKACTACQNCGQPSNWTHDDGGCPLCGKPRATPPIAAPAAHAERRKGQPDGYCGKEHESIFVPFTCNRTDLHDASDCKWRPDMWSPPLPLADAPPEPAKPEATTIMDCAVKPGWSHFPGVVCECKGVPKSPPAQEAPKAAPACGSNGELHGGEVLMRHFKKTKGYRCDHCFVLLENRHVGDGKFTGILRDPAIGERLPRPQLAADWVEDCLPTVWR